MGQPTGSHTESKFWTSGSRYQVHVGSREKKVCFVDDDHRCTLKVGPGAVDGLADSKGRRDRIVQKGLFPVSIPEKCVCAQCQRIPVWSSNGRLYFEDEKVIQEFTKPATPEQNAHIESYHSILESVICTKYEFENLEEAQDTMNRFVLFYNFERIHSGIDYTWPAKYLSENGIEIFNNENTRKTLNCDLLTFTSESMEPLQFIGG